MNYNYRYKDKENTKELLKNIKIEYYQYPSIRLEFINEKNSVIIAAKHANPNIKAPQIRYDERHNESVESFMKKFDDAYKEYDNKMIEEYKNLKIIGYVIDAISHDVWDMLNFQLSYTYDLDDMLEILDNIDVFFRMYVNNEYRVYSYSK